MKKLVFATNNAHKLEEVRAILSDEFEVLGLRDVGCDDDIPETADTLEGNAMLKAQYVFDKYGFSCFADDTGLEIEALGGDPGVYSARYAGEPQDAQANRNKVLANLSNVSNRAARFRTVIVLIMADGHTECFDGVVEGVIINGERGENGFGYDAIFVPDGYGETFAELSSEVKNSISHRANAVRRFADYLVRCVK